MTLKRLTLGISTTAILLALALAGCSRKDTAGKTTLQIKGSDTMVNLTQAWAEEYMKTHPGISIAVTGGGSGTGISSLLNNTCDIAQVSREMKEGEITLARNKGIDPKMIVVALDGLAVIVHPSNPLSEVTIDQLADLYTGKTTNWSQLGGHDARVVLLSREVNSGTHVYFKEHVLRHGRTEGKEEFTPGALLLPSSQAIADEAAQNPDAIGYYGMGYVSPKVKVLKIAAAAGAPFVSPTIESVQSNAYPISRPLIMYTKGEPKDLSKAFVEFVLSAPGQDVVRRLDFVPVVAH
jgi:phosphate transport system substrate-binding protein